MNRLMLQRKCDGGGGCCSDCDKKKLQREAIGPSPQRVPPIVHDVLRSSGEPLDRGTRAAMESRFDHDFSNVRLHRDDRAAESAAAVGARAYTVGANVVLGRNTDRDTLAHELAHTIQQERATYAGELEIGRADDPLEHDADGRARGRSGVVLRRQVKKDDRQHAGDPVKPEEKAKAAASVGSANINVGGAVLAREKAEPPTTKAPRFVLHDTAGLQSTKTIDAKLNVNRGPLGEGSNAWLPRDDAARITRPFFEKQRPTATMFEKNLEDLGETVTDKKNRERGEELAKRRDQKFRAIWSLINPNPFLHRLIFVAALAGKQLSLTEFKEERDGKDEKVRTAKGESTKHTPGAFERLTDPAAEMSTSASWAVEVIVNFTKNKAGAKILAAPGKAKELNDAAKELAPFFAAHNKRIAETVNVEMVQQGDNAAPKTLSYTANQYNNVRDLYLRAAVAAKVYPEITTHRLVDKNIGDHYDPRCFNLDQLYNRIATTLGHKVGASLYGVEPTYGPGDDKAVWWGAACVEPKPK